MDCLPQAIDRAAAAASHLGSSVSSHVHTPLLFTLRSKHSSNPPPRRAPCSPHLSLPPSSPIRRIPHLLLTHHPQPRHWETAPRYKTSPAPARLSHHPRRARRRARLALQSSLTTEWCGGVAGASFARHGGGGMERYGVLGVRLDGSGGGELPPGFRFHPTDEELITYYLLRKVVDGSFCGRAIAEIDLNKCEPWELPDKAKMGEKEWYFYSLRDRKYPTGLRTNRATGAGYWKATGKDREIRSGRTGALVGMKKTLVFYRGRAPKGQKTHWVMHEFRLDGTYAYHFLSNSLRDEWVIARVFQKPGVATPPRKTRLGLSSAGGGDTSCFSDSTSVSFGGGGGGASASSAPRPPPLPDTSLFAAAAAADGESSSHGGAAADVVTGRELVPCFSTAHMDATLGVGQYAPAPLAMEPTPAFFPSLRSLQENLQLPLFLSGGLQTGVSPLGVGSVGGALHWPSGIEMKVEGVVGRATPQMTVGPGQLDGAFAWGF